MVPSEVRINATPEELPPTTVPWELMPLTPVSFAPDNLKVSKFVAPDAADPKTQTAAVNAPNVQIFRLL
jgi:hypothetical protein